jgi:hypothetical protein
VLRWTLPSAEPAVACVMSFAVGLGLLSAIDLVLTAFGAYRTTPVSAITMTLGVLGAALLLGQRRSPKVPSRSLSLALVTLLVVLMLGIAASALAPETQFDALNYHLGFPLAWLRTGHLTFFPWQIPAVYAFIGELLYGNAIALAGTIAAKVVNLGYLVILLAATVDLGRRLYGERAALIGALALIVCPIIIWEGSTADTDLIAAAYVVLAVDTAVIYTRTLNRRVAVLCGLFTGFAVAAHYTAGFALLAIGMLLVLGPRWGSVRTRLIDVGIVGILAGLPSLPYLIRAVVLTGDPLFPFFYGVFGAKSYLWNNTASANLSQAQAHFGVGHGAVKLLILPWDLAAHPNAFGGGFGIVLSAAALLSLTRSPRRVPSLVAIGALSYVVLWFWPGGTLQARYIIPPAALLAPFAGAGIERLVNAFARWRPAAVVPVVLGMVAAVLVAPFIGYQGYHAYGSVQDAARGLRYVLGESAAHYEAAYIPTYGAEVALKRLGRPGERVISFSSSDVDQVTAPEVHVPYYAPQAQGLHGTDREALATLRSLHAPFILLERGILTNGAERTVTSPGFERRYLRRVYNGPTSTLYEVRRPLVTQR